jgi:hypothetical protein
MRIYVQLRVTPVQRAPGRSAPNPRSSCCQGFEGAHFRTAACRAGACRMAAACPAACHTALQDRGSSCRRQNSSAHCSLLRDVLVLVTVVGTAVLTLSRRQAALVGQGVSEWSVVSSVNAQRAATTAHIATVPPHHLHVPFSGRAHWQRLRDCHPLRVEGAAEVLRAANVVGRHATVWETATTKTEHACITPSRPALHATAL